MNHWLIMPIVLPAVLGPLLIMLGRIDHVLARILSLAGCVALIAISVGLLQQADSGPQTYALSAWVAPFGILLVLDRLSAVMLVLTAVLATVVLLYAMAGWDRRGRHFHALYQFQLMGINGAFLTGDFFNLFVFFEILLIASYGLMVHGGGADRLRAGVQYVIVNLVGSTLFLIAVGLIYSVTGTLNMADLALKVPQVSSDDLALLQIGTLLLLLVFGVKAALVPVHFWLPDTYAQAPAPTAALFAILTKVGAYCILRLYVLAFGAQAGASAWLAQEWLLPAAMVSLTLGLVGVLAAKRLGQLASFSVIGSMGTVLTAIALFTPTATAAALYYMLHSTLAAAALFLLTDLVRERRGHHSDALTVAPVFAHRSLLAAAFFVAAIAMAGLPPLSGFLGKLLILQSAWPTPYAFDVYLALLSTALLGIIGFVRAGSTLFWKSTAQQGRIEAEGVPHSVLPWVAVGLLLSGIVALTVGAGGVHDYLSQTAQQLYQPQIYINAVLFPQGGQ